MKRRHMAAEFPARWIDNVVARGDPLAVRNLRFIPLSVLSLALRVLVFVPVAVGTVMVACSQDATAPVGAEVADVADVADVAASDFMRFTQDDERGRLETAIVRYAHPERGTVDLIGVVHVGDTAYYEALNKRFEGYDAVLYEMIGNPEDVQDADRLASNQNPMRMLQRMVKAMLKLDYQLDAIDYTRSNFVHADLGMDAFKDLMAERGESIFTIFQNAMRESAASGGEGAASASSLPIDLAPILAALASPDSASALKLVVAEQLEKAETLLNAVESKSGTVILTERNKHVMKVIDEQQAAGRKKLGVLYGAGHLVDLERRLREAGYRMTGAEWMTAWDIPKPPKRSAKPVPAVEDTKSATQPE